MGVTFSIPIMLTYGTLMLSLIALWFPLKNRTQILLKNTWLWLFGISSAFGIYFGFVHFSGVCFILLFGVCCFFYENDNGNKWVRISTGVGIVLLATGLCAHKIPGFSNPVILSGVLLSVDAIPYTKYLNFDKSIVGLFLLGFGSIRIRHLRELLFLFRKGFPAAILTIGIVMIFSFLLGYTRFDPKWPSFIIFWMLTNLLMTCLAEEALFRLFIQNRLINFFARFRIRPQWGIFIAACLFGMAHFQGGMKYVFLATVAGMGYGWTYYNTNHIEGSILTHFFLNTVHILFFTYPALASEI